MLAPCASQAMSLQPHDGDALTQTQLFAYLFTAPQRGDWLRYRLSAGFDTRIYKTVGFGAADEHNSSAYIEITTASSAVLSVPTMSGANVGGTMVWKMFVDAADFEDPLRKYAIMSSAFKIGDGLFRLRESPTLGVPSQRVLLQTLIWSGLLPLDDARSGVVSKIEPQDLLIQGKVVHSTHVVVDFAETTLPGGGRFPQERLEAWQSPDVPLGTVRVRLSVMGQTYATELVAFGRGNYHAIITQPLDLMARFPGSQ